MTYPSDGLLPGFQWVPNPKSAGNPYATSGPARIMCHMTVGTGLSAGYIAGHSVPPQLWANPYDGQRYQCIPLTRAAYALYQPQYGGPNAWTNKHGYTVQVEIVGVPQVNVVTYSDSQNRWIGEQVIAPIIQWFIDMGIPYDLNTCRKVDWSSGSASVDWPGRMSEDELVNTGGLVQHIVEWGNDHWDCSVERLDSWLDYAKLKLAGVTPKPTPTTGDDMPWPRCLDEDGTAYVIYSDGTLQPCTGPTMQTFETMKLVGPYITEPNNPNAQLHVGKAVLATIFKVLPVK